MLEKDENIPTVKFKDLIPDGHNIVDRAFRSGVARFMDQNMPGGPMGLLSTENPERWQIQPDSIHEVVRVDVPGEEDEDEDEDDEDEEDEEGERASALRSVYCIRNTTTNEWITDWGYSRGVDYDETVTLDNEDVLAWEDESDAKSKLDELDQAYDNEHGHESRLAIPWGHSWWYRPDTMISDGDLKEAGFTVATYVGGEGDWQGDEEFRLAGIDMVGSSHEPYYAKLYAKVAERRNWKIETDNGPAYVTFDYRTDLERMADAGSE